MKLFQILLCAGLFLLSASIYSQSKQIRITGKVSDQETGEPLPGATVFEEGTSTGTVSGLDGDYSILVPDSDATLTFSFIGYVTQEIAVGDNKLGASLSASTERENRSTQTMSANYGIIGEEIEILINNSSLNKLIEPAHGFSM